MSKGKARSPYVRHSKAPYLYSPQYYAWRNAWRTGNNVEHAHETWEKAQGITRGKNQRVTYDPKVLEIFDEEYASEYIEGDASLALYVAG